MNIQINKLGGINKKELIAAEYQNKNAWFATIWITNTEGETIGIDLREVNGQLEILSKSNSLKITPGSSNSITIEPFNMR